MGLDGKQEGKRVITAAEYRQMISNPNRKYHNVKVKYDGWTFDSKLESERYIALQIMEATGQIKGFGVKPSFTLSPGDGKPIRYIADFIVWPLDGMPWVEDTKGVETEAFKIKRKLWAQAYPWMELRVIKREVTL